MKTANDARSPAEEASCDGLPPGDPFAMDADLCDRLRHPLPRRSRLGLHSLRRQWRSGFRTHVSVAATEEEDGGIGRPAVIEEVEVREQLSVVASSGSGKLRAFRARRMNVVILLESGHCS